MNFSPFFGHSNSYNRFRSRKRNLFCPFSRYSNDSKAMRKTESDFRNTLSILSIFV